MNKRIFTFLLIFVITISVGGCKNEDTEGAAKPTVTVSQNTNLAPTQEPTLEPDSSKANSSLLHTMKKEDYPIVDGSTATIPLSQAVYKLATGASQEEAEAHIVHTKTSNAYNRLLKGEVDLLIVYEPSKEMKNTIQSSNTKISIKPIGKDALVFMTNAANTVDSLTKEQLVDIYSGKITSWSQIGGKNQKILAFQRPANSGSQTLMQKLVMGNTPMVTGSNVLYYETMEGILEAMVDYNNEGNTLGYSVFYYAKNMYNLPELKFIKANGIEPRLETIHDNSYPFINSFYAVIREDEPKDSNAHKIFDWLSGSEGQTIIKDLGYVPETLDIDGDYQASNAATNYIKSIPNNKKYIAASYSTHEQIKLGTVTIYQDDWKAVKVFKNAFVPDLGLCSEDTNLFIGTAVYQKNDSYSLKWGIYSLKEGKYILSPIYDSLSVLDEEKGYYIVRNGSKNQVINIKGKVLASGFLQGEGYGVIKQGDFYWITSYDPTKQKNMVWIYDSDFALVKKMSVENGDIYNYDGSVCFSQNKFLKKIKAQADSIDTFYIDSNGSNQLFAVYYNKTAYLVDREYNIIAKKDNLNNDSFYSVYENFYSDSKHSNDITTRSFYDKNGKLIKDKEGNGFSDIYMQYFWSTDYRIKPGLYLYQLDDNHLRIYNYRTKEALKISLEDRKEAYIDYIFNDLVFVKDSNSSSLRIYKGNQLIKKVDGGFSTIPPENPDAEYILLKKYGNNETDNEYIILSNQGKIIYQSSGLENILSLDQNYIQVERGNYTCVIDYKGNYLIKNLKNDLRND